LSALGPSPTRWDRAWLLALLLAFAVQVVNVQIRSTSLHRCMNDLGVYTTAAWAIRAGVDPYDVTDTNGFHYVYPPLLAVLMGPLATAPAGAEAVVAVPFPFSVALWTLLSILFALLAVHWLACAVEATSLDAVVRNQPPGCRRWWRLRTLPLLVCMPPVMANLVHGQVNLLLLLLLSGMMASLLRGKEMRAGLLLSGAICLKVFPVFLLGYVVWRRRWRCLGGCALGLCMGLVIIPAAAVGPRKALAYHEKFAEVVLLPGLGRGSDRSRADELTNVVFTDSQSLMAVAHNALHLDRPTRPLTISPELRRTATLLGLGLTGLVIVAAGGRRLSSPRRELLTLGALSVNMLLLCPVCHMPYYSLLIPLIMALVDQYWLPAQDAVVARGWRGATGQGRLLLALSALFVINFVARILIHVSGLEYLKELGLSMLAGLPVWGLAVVVLWRSRRPALESAGACEPPRRQAA
jgi:hypothetical protein